MATTQPSTPTCVLDEIGSTVTWSGVVRAVGLLWSIPAALLVVAGYRFAFDRPPSPLASAFVDIGRGVSVLLAAFTFVVGAIWLVRTRPSLPGLGAIDRRTLTAGAHLRFGLIGLVAAVGSALIGDGRFALVVAGCAAVAGCVAGMIVPRWMLAVGRSDPSALLAPTVLGAVIVAEITLGWVHSMAMSDGASTLSGVLAIVRGLVIAVAALSVAIDSGRSA